MLNFGTLFSGMSITKYLFLCPRVTCMFTEGNQVSLNYFHLKAHFIRRAAVAPNLIHEFYYNYIRIHFKSRPNRWHDV